MRAANSPCRRGACSANSLLTLGGLSMLTGCSLTDDKSVNAFLTAVSRLNDRAQAFLFDPKQLAPTYTEAQITRPFPFNAFYGIDDVPEVDASSYTLKVSGLVTGQRDWTLPELYALPHAEQITRHICVEGWSAIGRWGGTPFRDFLRRVGADTSAKYVGFKCADDYYESIDMPTALHPQTLLTFEYDGERLPAKYGFPMKLRMPTKLGYKNPKHIVEMFVTNTYPWRLLGRPGLQLVRRLLTRAGCACPTASSGRSFGNTPA